MADNNTSDERSLGQVLSQLIGQLDLGSTSATGQIQELRQSTASGFEKLIQSSTSSSPSSTAASVGSGILSTLNPLGGGGGGGGLGSSILSGLVLGPLFRGLFSLFSGGEDAPAPALEPYNFPQSTTTFRDAATAPNGDALSLRSDGLGLTRDLPAAQPTIQLSIQALDARSILERSEDIASAVRQAMLSNHNINDNLNEI